MAASYGYGGGYTANTSTTSYGAQGGAGGGGFMSGSQAGGQESPSGAKNYGKETLRPITIKQALEAQCSQYPFPTADPKIDGVDVTQLSIIGQILKVSPQTTNTTFSLDDGTGTIDVKQWVDSGESSESTKLIPKEGEYIHVWGSLKDFNGKRTIGSRTIRTVTDYNEISYHLLEATAVHLHLTRGPPGQANGTTSEGLFVDNNGGATNAQAPGGKILSRAVGPAGRAIYKFLAESPQGNEGLHVANIAQALGISQQEVFKGGDELLAEGCIYTTIDDETWAVLDY
ncbi:hypothetical protein B0O99DRAFT_653274 [Bisporella sp. PMI_857]|nr:hypothetical protein B0O99DRAFT_653274 [Bisporella sp. PMI_857]